MKRRKKQNDLPVVCSRCRRRVGPAKAIREGWTVRDGSQLCGHCKGGETR